MSVEAFTWALTVPVGGNAKVVLLGLANHAHPDGTESYPALDTLAVYAHCDRSTARRNVRKLAADGWIVEDGLGPKGQTKWRLAMGGKTPPVAPAPDGGGNSTSEGVAPVPPEPSIEPSTNRSDANGARASDQAPEDFPDELRPHARIVLPILRKIAEERGGRAVSVRSLGNTIMARPRRPLVKSAYDLAAWLDDRPSRKVRDVVATYRSWLDREDDLAAVERIPSATSGPVATGGNVTPLRRNASAEERRQHRQSERMRRAQEPPPAAELGPGS